MRLRQIIEYVDGMKANAYSPRQKTQWLNELENSIRMDVKMLPEGRDHVWEGEWSGEGVTFPDDRTMVIPGWMDAGVGGVISIEGLDTYEGNNIHAVVLDAVCGPLETVLTFPGDTFPASGTEPETATAMVRYDGGMEPMEAPEQWSKIYYTYLEARIAFANGEYSEYANILALYDRFLTEYLAWYCRKYIDK